MNTAKPIFNLHIKRLFFTAALLLAFIPAHSQNNADKIPTDNQFTQEEQITQVTYSITGGGKYGGDKIVVITKDSILYDSKNPSFNISVKIHLPNNTGLTNELIKSIDIKEFAKIKSKPSDAENDGADFAISIQTTKKLYTEMNGFLNSKTRIIREKLDAVIDYVKSYF